MAFAFAYAPLNHNKLGEMDAALTTNVLLPVFAAAVQAVGQESGYLPELLLQLFSSPMWLMFVVPPFFSKVSATF